MVDNPRYLVYQLKEDNGCTTIETVMYDPVENDPPLSKETRDGVLARVRLLGMLHRRSEVIARFNKEEEEYE